MFCSSLRKRKEWISIPPSFLMEQMPKWQEKTLGTHDIAIPIPQIKSNYRDYFRFLLLSSYDLDSEAVMTRIERLYYQSGGRNVGIIFLLHEKGSEAKGIAAYMKLQVSLTTTFQMPLLPLSTTEQLLTIIQTFQKQLLSTSPHRVVDTQFELLPACTVGAAMAEHTRNVLSDICDSIHGLAYAATVPEGQDRLKGLLSDAAAKDVIDFWEKEHLLE